MAHYMLRWRMRDGSTGAWDETVSATTNKPSGNRMNMDEAALYTVRDGKIVREEFFYDTAGM